MNENYRSSQLNIPKFISAQKLLEDKFFIELAKNNKNKKEIELILGNKVCIVKPHLELVYETIVSGHLPKRHPDGGSGLESTTVYVLVGDNKFDFYNTFFNILIL